MERKYAILTDNGCDMPKEYLEEHGVSCVMLGFTMDGVQYYGDGGESITTDEFYTRLRAGAMPTTYQATAEMVKDSLRPLLERGQDVLCVSFSSGLSGTYGSYMMAAKEMMEEYKGRKVVVVDSLCASMGQGLLLDYIVRKADEGETLEDTAAYAEEIKGRVAHCFTADDLFHLKRGGRVSGVTAAIGTLLKIKPVMRVSEEGKLEVVNKAMGRKKALHTIVDNLLLHATLGKNDPIFISHADCLEEAERVRAMFLERYPNARIMIGEIGAVIGTHAGAGTVAVFCLGKR